MYWFAGMAVALVCVRSAVWLLWEQSYFDSDQAVVGLMTKHLAEGRAFPLFFYGQHYMLGVEAWLAAPLFRWFGPSVVALKVPLLAINVLIACLLLKIFVEDVGLRPGMAFVSSLFFVLPPPVTSSRLMEAQGGNIEPFLYTVLLWLARDRPALFGLVAGVGVLNREFTAYAIAAMLIVEWWNGVLFSKRNLRSKLVALVFALGVAVLVRVMTPHADLLGPGTAGPGSAIVLNNLDLGSISKLCWNTQIASNVEWLFSRNLSLLFGWDRGSFSPYFRSDLVGGQSWLVVPLLGLFGVVLVAWVTRLRATHDGEFVTAPRSRVTEGQVPGAAFPAYVALVGVVAAMAYTLSSCLVQDAMLIRYTLLTLFVPIGALGWLFRVERSRTLRMMATASVLVWAVAGGIDDVRLLTRYVRRPPVNEYRRLSAFLEQSGIAFGRAPYWTAYQIDFLSHERLTIASSDFVRVKRYQDLVDEHQRVAVTIADLGPSCSGERTIQFLRWCITTSEGQLDRPVVR